jgi:hypothetical protein
MSIVMTQAETVLFRLRTAKTAHDKTFLKGQWIEVSPGVYKAKDENGSPWALYLVSRQPPNGPDAREVYARLVNGAAPRDNVILWNSYIVKLLLHDQEADVKYHEGMIRQKAAEVFGIQNAQFMSAVTAEVV